MSGIRIVEVDERDSTWEDHAPVFRVHFRTSGPDSTHGSTATYDETGADLVQVIDWAQRRAGDTLTYAVALVRAHRGGQPLGPASEPGLVWLVGCDGNDVAVDAQQDQRQSRMLARRAEPVRIPQADRMPGGTAP